MSRVHDAMRTLEQKSAPEPRSSPALSNLVGALIEELADEVPDEPYLETVRADLMAASRSYENCKKKDLVLRFYLTIRSLLREHALLQERLKKAEASNSKKNQIAEPASLESVPLSIHDRQERAEVRLSGALPELHAEQAAGQSR